MTQMQPVVLQNDANNQLLYFTSSSVTEDDKKLFFISDRTGSPNVFVKYLESEIEIKITDNSDSYLKSYVYFDGTPNLGLGKASICLDVKNETIYYLQGLNICAADINGNIRVLNQTSPDEVTAFTHVSSDGKFLCVPTTDGRALEYDTIIDNKVPYDIDKRVQEEYLNSYLNVYDTQTGELVLRETVNRAWITHVQFCPTNPNLILYNHEWPANCDIRRMWLFNGKDHIRLRPAQGLEAANWVCHEMYKQSGETIIYHGGYINGLSFVGKLDQKTLKQIEVAFPENYKKYGHFTISDNDLLVTDGYYQEEGEENDSSAKYISVLSVNWDSKKIQWTPLCEHKSGWQNQDCHPHPIFNHSGNKVYFTSNVSGRCGVYCTEVSENI